MRLLQAVESIWSGGVGSLIWVDEERFLAVLNFDIRFRYAGLEVEDGVAARLRRLDK
jgi:hypothetical protein